MLSMIPAALSLAATVLALPQDPTSGTVGAGAAGNTYPNCPDPDETCVSYGVDFHNDGIYFQNSALTDPFTFATVFDGKLMITMSTRRSGPSLIISIRMPKGCFCLQRPR